MGQKERNEGFETELRLAKFLKSKGYKPEFSSITEDRMKHFDIIIDGKKLDVKGMRRLKVFSDEYVLQDYLHIIEIQNVQGRKGWLYGEADFFVFELERFWVFVPKAELQKLVRDQVNHDFVKRPMDAIYKLYTRKNQKDILTLFKSTDLLAISSLILSKDGLQTIRVRRAKTRTN